MVTKYKLGYDPVEVDPEDMVRCSCVWLEAAAHSQAVVGAVPALAGRGCCNLVNLGTQLPPLFRPWTVMRCRVVAPCLPAAASVAHAAMLLPHTVAPAA